MTSMKVLIRQVPSGSSAIRRFTSASVSSSVFLKVAMK